MSEIIDTQIPLMNDSYKFPNHTCLLQNVQTPGLLDFTLRNDIYNCFNPPSNTCLPEFTLGNDVYKYFQAPGPCVHTNFSVQVA